MEIFAVTNVRFSKEASASNWKTPVIVITGTDDEALLAAADRDIVTATLQKPTGPDALLAAVAEALRQSSRNG